MSRIALLVLLAAACTKSDGNREAAQQPTRPTKIDVPGADPGPGVARGTTEGATAQKTAPTDDGFRLKPDEGQLAIQVPADAKAGQETTASVVVTPGPKYKINFEYPTKLTLESPEGIKLAKAEMKAGGQDKAKGDAEAFEEKQLRFAVKLTPSASGSYTINGSFKFAVCDKDQCLAKKEPIAIQVAAK